MIVYQCDGSNCRMQFSTSHNDSIATKYSFRLGDGSTYRFCSLAHMIEFIKEAMEPNGIIGAMDDY